MKKPWKQLQYSLNQKSNILNILYSQLWFKVPINPAYQSNEIEYCINKVRIKGLVMDYKFKSQNYYELLHAICKEMPTSQPGDIKSSNLPTLRNVVMLSDERHR